eukprot:GABV01009590.1.p1 GENE.GABV01009590.1~~GABV01009590.1.p1  ORF type:complete len:131 (-),score=33.96 GABV01009590.1:40-432(-)
MPNLGIVRVGFEPNPARWTQQVQNVFGSERGPEVMQPLNPTNPLETLTTAALENTKHPFWISGSRPATPILDGLRVAKQVMEEGHRAGAAKFVVMISDGNPTAFRNSFGEWEWNGLPLELTPAVDELWHK